MDAIFKGLFDTSSETVIKIGDFLFCLAAALLLGIITALAYYFRNEHTKSFVITLALLPAAVAVVIMMVNGNIGAGVAVAGAFSLVRFRSAPGSAKEIVAIFISMGTGLIVGMGYLAFGAVYTVVMCAALVFCNYIGAKAPRRGTVYKTVKITVPEDLDYSGAFEEVFTAYTRAFELIKVKTVNFGSMFRLTYDITLSDVSREKELIDRLRERNGNLEITVSRRENRSGEL